MTFFLSNPPPEDRETEGSASTSPYSAKSGALFKQDNVWSETLAGEHISLSAYISKHLNASETEVSAPTEAIPEKPKALGFPMPENKANTAHKTGLFLNSLDVDMPSGLEQYLPSPIFRLRIAKKRIDGEIRELRQRLNKYERLPEKAPALQEQMILLSIRLESLEQQQRQFSQQLSNNLSVVPMLYALSQQGKGLENIINAGIEALRKFLLALFYGRAYLDLQADGDEMITLKDMYAERLQAGTCTDSELSAILNRFDQVVLRAESDARKLKPTSFAMRLWQEAKGLVK